MATPTFSEASEPLLVPSDRRSDKVTKMFAEELAIQLDAFAASPAEAGPLVHRLRGSCAAVGAQRMMTACEDVERRVRRGDAIDHASEVTRLRTLFADTLAAMAAERATPARAGT